MHESGLVLFLLVYYYLFSELLRTFFKNEISLVINPKIQQLNKIKRKENKTKQVLAVKKERPSSPVEIFNSPPDCHT